MTDQILLRMLSYRRPAGSRAEHKFIQRFITPSGAAPDAFGNYILRIGKAPILWSSHTDTVHNSAGRQTVEVNNGFASVKHQNCLGGDCTVGVYLMLEMIKAGVEGLYVFHREEECGGRGSSFIATKTPWLLDGITSAIAFDRLGYKSIITHQWDGRCCSTAFARSLWRALYKPHGMEWALDSGGTFTDTANYTDIIPECTNLSVGYFAQHTKYERVDLGYVERLRQTLIEADFSGLVVERVPQPSSWASNYNSHGGYTAGKKWDWDDAQDDQDEDDGRPFGMPSSSARTNHDWLLDLCKDHPEAVASYLDMNGVSPIEVMQETGLVGKAKNAA